MFNVDCLIDNTKFSVQFILDKLPFSDYTSKNFDSASEKEEDPSKTIKIRSLAGNGFLSYVNRISIRPYGVTEKFSAIFKVPTLEIISSLANFEENESLEHLTNIISYHNQEVKFYQNISPYIQGHETLKRKIPKAYAFQSCYGNRLDDLANGFILMEDLSINESKSTDICETLTEKQIESTIEAFAILHAVSAIIPEEIVNSMVYDEKVDYKVRLQNFLECLIILPDFDFYFARHKKPLSNLLNYVSDYGFFKGHEVFGMRPVVSHGDLWNSNMLYSSNGSLAGIIDWQCAHPNTGINDLVNLFLTSVNAELRQRHQDAWLQLYFDKLHLELDQIGVDESPIKNMDMLKEVVKFHFPIQLVSAMMVIMRNLTSREKTITPEQRLELVQRLVYGFEEIRSQFEKIDGEVKDITDSGA